MAQDAETDTKTPTAIYMSAIPVHRIPAAITVWKHPSPEMW